MALATIEGIRNQIATLLTALTPASLTGDKFRQSRDEANADFQTWADANPAACLRRFQVRHDGGDDLPEVSNTDVSQLRCTFVIRIAYPTTHRYGAQAGRDRDDVIDEDWRKVNYAVGVYGRGNFSGANDCCPLGARRDIERGEKVDYMVVTASYLYSLDVDA